MSKAMAFRRPTAAARNRDAATPPAGPDTAMASGRRRATAADIMPPLDWSRWSVAPTPAAGERGLEVGEVPVRDRHDRRVQRRRRRALVLPELRVDLVGHGDERDLPLERRPEARLVGRMRVGVEEADGHRLDAARAERRRQRRQLVLRERHGDPAVGEDALRHLEPEVAGHERRRPRRDVEPVELLAALPGDLEHVAEAPRRDEGRPGVPALDDRVRDDRGPVGDRAGVRRQRLETGQDAARRRLGRREHLAASGPRRRRDRWRRGR